MNRFVGLIRASGATRRMIGTAACVSCMTLHFSAVSAQDEPFVSQPGDHGLEAYVSNEALQALYTRGADIGELNGTELQGGFFLNEARDFIGIAGLLTTLGEPDQSSRWLTEVGPRAYGALLDQNRDVFGVGIGGRISYFLSADRSTAVTVGGWYAPNILTFGEAEDIKDVGLEFQTRLTSSVNVFVGWRTFELDLDVPREVDDGIHLGFRGTF